MPEGILKLQLLFITAIDSIGDGGYDQPLVFDFLPEFAVIKLASIGMARGVIDILNINKNRNFFIPA